MRSSFNITNNETIHQTVNSSLLNTIQSCITDNQHNRSRDQTQLFTLTLISLQLAVRTHSILAEIYYSIYSNI